MGIEYHTLSTMIRLLILWELSTKLPSMIITPHVRFGLGFLRQPFEPVETNRSRNINLTWIMGWKAEAQVYVVVTDSSNSNLDMVNEEAASVKLRCSPWAKSRVATVFSPNVSSLATWKGSMS